MCVTISHLLRLSWSASAEIITIIASHVARRLQPRRTSLVAERAGFYRAVPLPSPAAQCGPDRRGRPNALASVGFVPGAKARSAPQGWFTLVRPSGPVWAFGPGYRTPGRHGKSWTSRPARRLSRPSSVRPLPLVRMACRAGNHCNLVAGMRAFWRLSFTVVLTRI